MNASYERLKHFISKNPYGLVLSLLLLSRLLAIFVLPLNDTTEARYGEIARKMLETNDWVTLWHDYGVPFWGKPPLYSWLSALSMSFFGINTFALRLPSLLLSIAMLWIVYDFTKKQWDIQCARLSVLVLSSSVFFFLDAGTVMTDPALLFSTTLSLIAAYNTLTNKSTFWGYTFFIGLSIGLLSKGPLVLVLVGLPILIWTVICKQWKALFTHLPLIGGTITLLILVLPWYILAELHTPGFLQYFIIGEHLGRFLIPGWTGDKYGFAHYKPIAMIWVYFFVGFLPWSIAALSLTIQYRKKWSLSFIHRNNTLFWFLLAWCIAPLLFFTPAKNILYTYCFTALPPAAILFSKLFYSLTEHKKEENICVGLAFGIAILGLFVSVFSLTMPQHINKSQKLLIAAWKKENPSTNNALIYWGKTRQYSAEFYANGKIHYVDNQKDLQKLLKPNQFMVISSEEIDKVPQKVLSSLEVQTCYPIINDTFCLYKVAANQE